MSREWLQVFDDKITVASLVDYIDDYLYDVYNDDAEPDGTFPKFDYRPSQLAKSFKCVRKLVFQKTGAEFDVDSKGHSAQTHRVFLNGHDVHARLQSIIAELDGWSEGKAKLIGRWTCAKCGERHGYDKDKEEYFKHFVRKPTKCNNAKCDSKSFYYDEVNVEIKPENIFGTGDGIVEVDGDLYLLEIKSVSPYTFPKIKEVPDYYEHQINLYMHGLGIYKTLFLFECKGTQKMLLLNYSYKPGKVKEILNAVKKATKAIQDKKFPLPLKKPEDINSMCTSCEYIRVCKVAKEFKENALVADYTDNL